MVRDMKQLLHNHETGHETWPQGRYAILPTTKIRWAVGRNGTADDTARHFERPSLVEWSEGKSSWLQTRINMVWPGLI